MYLDSENWLKASVEYENEEFQHLGSVVTNHGYSDWATTAIPANVKTMWYRFSRREDDYCIECSYDGVNFSQIDDGYVFCNGNIECDGKVTYYPIYMLMFLQKKELPSEIMFDSDFSDLNSLV